MRFAPMFRSFNMFMLVLVIGVVAWTFKVKNDSREAYLNIVKLEQQIKDQENEIDLFHSDWSLLTSPQRLEKLAERYGPQLGLLPMQASQMTDEDNLPPLKSEIENQTPELDEEVKRAGFVIGTEAN